MKWLAMLRSLARAYEAPTEPTEPVVSVVSVPATGEGAPPCADCGRVGAGLFVVLADGTTLCAQPCADRKAP